MFNARQILFSHHIFFGLILILFSQAHQRLKITKDRSFESVLFDKNLVYILQEKTLRKLSDRKPYDDKWKTKSIRTIRNQNYS